MKVHQCSSVHDTNVCSDLRDTLSRIDSRTDDALEITECRSFINGMNGHIEGATRGGNPGLSAVNNSGQKKQKAIRCLDTMSRGGPISTFNTTESHILAVTWARTKHPNNTENKSLMQEAIFEALADAFDTNGNLLCANGRCSRCLSSLVLLDYDPAVGSAQTFSAYRREVMQRVEDMFEEELQGLNSGDEKEKELALSYEDPSITPDDDTESRFHNRLKSKIEDILEEYKPKFSARDIEKLREEALIYACI